jgi:H+/Cl- antiporter ClcA
MPTVPEFLALLLTAAFFAGFGWHFSQVARLWSTPEYGGTRYRREYLLAIAYGVFLGIAALLAHAYEIPDETRKNGTLVAAVLLPVGWGLRARSIKRKSAA